MSGVLRRAVLSVIVAVTASYILLTVYLIFLASSEEIEAAFTRSTAIVGVVAAILVGPTYWLLRKRENERRAVAIGRKALWGSLASAIIVGLVMGVMALGGYLSGAD